MRNSVMSVLLNIMSKFGNFSGSEMSPRKAPLRGGYFYCKSNRSAFMTFDQAAMKSLMNLSLLSSCA